MAGTSLLALLDDIASMLDDISAMTKVTAGKTTGLLGDDLALNANQLTGLRAERELPVVWAVAKGSFINKGILLPLAFLISAFIPWLIQPLLMLGGAYLCFEGAEKVWHFLARGKKHTTPAVVVAGNTAHDAAAAQLTETRKRTESTRNKLTKSREELLVFEKDKIKGAIRTDFILSAEIIVIALGTVQHMALMGAIVVVSLIAVLMTVGVYSLVAGIVKLDDVGLYLITRAGDDTGAFSARLGRGILSMCPGMMKTLSIVGTLAMFLVGGSILMHGVPVFAHGVEEWFHAQHLAAWVNWIGILLVEMLTGLVLGSVLVVIISAIMPAFQKEKA
ncbi:DUF808 domain-containing protein [Aestuariicella hydrocarbonica]|uniref:DUF808 domain-containing protein n=1 Tax=Pseudomaricurvus hydrocarbonicus TaxID=1470433 RepID=A0A9E5MHV2_9GAMM|nr:DUF808 domain-containing protein [Aestuariicella hydrocarbonica]NHO66441.1 DUF808 domain-containing protein [Aestuariicella hydrocarbonica]